MNLVKTNFRDVFFERADLSSAEALRFHMQGGSMARASLMEADFRNALFMDVDFRESDVTHAGLDGAHFKGAKAFGMLGRPAFLEGLTAEAVDLSPGGNGGRLVNGDAFRDGLNAERR